ncbi:MAG: hypothetical protein FD174_2440 [Geobacteraceae bacterium]|nr:MAG: hypothetical protein FD174_2440 [Geobacteraceae bacterium]
MPEKLLIPSIEKRLAAFVEATRRAQLESESKRKARPRPTITISREFGCEAYPMTEKLKELLEEKTGETWALMDKALLEEVTRNHNLSENVLRNLGTKPRFLDEMFSTLSPRWRSEKDHYKLLCSHIVSLAEAGNVIIVGRGSSIVTQPLENCFHFRMFASPDFKTKSIARRLNLSPAEAEKMVHKKQSERDKFIRDFLDRNAEDLSFYHLIFNNDKNSTGKIARTIVDYIAR